MFAHRKGSSVLGAGLLALAASSAIMSSAVLTPAALGAQGTPDSGSLSAGLAAYEAFKYDDAARILKPLADAGEAEAQYTMAMLHMMGEGVAESPAAMVAYATKADKQGHMGARTLLALLLCAGTAVGLVLTGWTWWGWFVGVAGLAVVAAQTVLHGPAPGRAVHEPPDPVE